MFIPCSISIGRASHGNVSKKIRSIRTTASTGCKRAMMAVDKLDGARNFDVVSVQTASDAVKGLVFSAKDNELFVFDDTQVDHNYHTDTARPELTLPSA